MLTALLVGLGGVLGSLARFGLDAAVEGYRERRRPARPVGSGPPFPVGTLVVNVIGSAIIGFAWGALQASDITQAWYLASAAGLAGGLTTFSTLTVAAGNLWQGRRPGAAVVLVVGNLTLGLGAAWCGLGIATLL